MNHMFHIYELHRKTKQIEEMFVSTANLTGDYNEASAKVAIMTRRTLNT